MYLLTLVALLATALATPDPAPQASSPRPRVTPTHLYVCTDASFAGKCSNLSLKPSVCYTLGPNYARKVSSAGPDKGTFCTLYSEKGCRGKALPFTWPGIRRLGRYEYDDTTSSVRCDYITGYSSHP
ncbi:hypothetical protein BDU57DRAFT_519953 [Ampelomyces quisqualis]|uniref:Beta/gamma crystallin 'Greek key' domain-containing protein n=1 Tax=Ampelomyces quisqualis TaxID=50730 RepID=A0A6A5QGB7_AMPQU|nr:hypothetical protein BDU57DRAFT_519953 [Ampelomyces quisqualis]